MRPKDKLILAMLNAIEQLGETTMARIDARWWARHFRRKIRKLNIELPVKGDKT